MERINLLLDELKYFFKPFNWLGLSINEIVNNNPLNKTIEWTELFHNAKEDISKINISSAYNNEVLHKQIINNIIEIQMFIDKHEFTVDQCNKNKTLSSCIREWERFTKWIQKSILLIEIPELKNISVTTTTDNTITFHINPDCQNKCKNEFITDKNLLCNICPILKSNEKGLILTKEQFKHVSDKSNFLKNHLDKSDIKITSLLTSKESGTHVYNWNDLFLSWNEIKEYCLLEQGKLNKTSEIETTDLPEIELTTQKEQIRLFYELGVIEFLQNKYPATLKGNNNQISKLISQILKLEQPNIQPTVNALLTNTASNKNYPKETKKTKAIIDQLNSNESI